MGIKYDNSTKSYTVTYSKRHPKTRRPYSLRRIGLKSRSQALKIEKELIVQLERKFQEVICPRWRDLVEEYKEFNLNQGMSIKSVENYYLCLKAHTFKEWGERLTSGITSNEIRILVKETLSYRSPSHQKNILKYIRGAMSFAYEKEYIDRNPTPQIKFRIGDKLKSVLTEDEVKKLLKYARELKSEWHPIWAAALYTGMRNGELYALTWDKVDLERRRIIVNCSWNNKSGFKDTKTGDDRILEIAIPLVGILRQLKKYNTETTFVFPRIDRWDKGEQARELRMFLLSVGLPRIRFHDLRATWATIMLSKGVPPIKVMMMGGWKDLKTMQYYIRKSGLNIKGITDNLKF